MIRPDYKKQFTYRYQVLFAHWDEDKGDCRGYNDEERDTTPELDYIEEALYDGTHDKLHDGGLMRYHGAGKPKKLAVRWHIGKRQWMAYFWFGDKEIHHVFDRFYSVYPDAKADLMIRIDTEKDKYEVAFCCSGLSEPLVIPEKTFQLLVFRNGFECYRSSNYNQPTGAWIW